jgi:ABC-type multidrug transport system ATPase subunit
MSNDKIPQTHSLCLRYSVFVLFSAGVIVYGDIRVNGRPIGGYMHRLSGFMYQDDLFVSSFTVQEHLFFMVRT